MRFLKWSLLVAFIAAVAGPLHAEGDAAWVRSRLSNALNPRISVIGDFVGQVGPHRTNEASLRGVELAIQAEVDPNTRADFFFGYHDEHFELEEGYITLLALPLRFQSRAGKFNANFGRLNMVHTHELAQVDRPLALARYLGEEGLSSTGAELSRVFAPFGLFSEITYAFLNELGERHGRQNDDDDDDGHAHGSRRNLGEFAHVARLRFFRDMTDAANLELGFSGALHQPRHADRTRLGGADLTLRWRPVQEGMYRSFIWRTEALYAKRSLVDVFEGEALEEPAAKLERYAGYSYMELQATRRFSFGVRGDYVEDPNHRGGLEVTRAFSPYITLTANEFNRYRVQYQYRHMPDGHPEHTGWLQWTVVLGPHGAHPF